MGVSSIAGGLHRLASEGFIAPACSCFQFAKEECRARSVKSASLLSDRRGEKQWKAAIAYQISS
ncbi:hypothetical protein IE4803_PD00490 (plasmid) [Rhizobium etli bv. phaseoli str. IE4803]|uniref:Uncharacterized protein n=1 Tax=Rhizobium etli bv. mimosae str. IE4771 TaxID=1432050 RepID=A0A060IDM1_RHIET|nr:hypothetical protein IE4771_PE00506 [Rhizobium sp. IE4771]AJC83687.1 hypothetical protein IE4803_PD00490 [Rhizobium etli bv. phaseoli str. IE4803]